MKAGNLSDRVAVQRYVEGDDGYGNVLLVGPRLKPMESRSSSGQIFARHPEKSA